MLQQIRWNWKTACGEIAGRFKRVFIRLNVVERLEVLRSFAEVHFTSMQPVVCRTHRRERHTLRLLMAVDTTRLLAPLRTAFRVNGPLLCGIFDKCVVRKLFCCSLQLPMHAERRWRTQPNRLVACPIMDAVIPTPRSFLRACSRLDDSTLDDRQLPDQCWVVPDSDILVLKFVLILVNI